MNTALISILAVLLLLAAAAAVYFFRKASALQAYLDKIEEGDRVKNKFLKNIMLEIRTPLDAVVGFSDVCSTFDDLPDKERKEYISYVHRNSEVLLRLLSGVLDVARYDSLCPEVQLSDFDLGDEIINTLTALESGIKMKPGVILDYSRANQTFIVHGDTAMVDKIMLNLVHNALNYTQSGSVTIDITKTSDGFAKVSVQDTGCGISKDDIPQLFRQDYKVDSLSQGTGLGLFLCKTLVMLQGGKIGVDSKVGEGSTFWFTLPLAKLQ